MSDWLGYEARIAIRFYFQLRSTRLRYLAAIYIPCTMILLVEYSYIFSEWINICKPIVKVLVAWQCLHFKQSDYLKNRAHIVSRYMIFSFHLNVHILDTAPETVTWFGTSCVSSSIFIYPKVLKENIIIYSYVICSSARNGTTFTCKKTKVRNKH